MRTIDFRDNVVRLIDQTRLPRELRFVECRTWSEIAEAIGRMQVRGAMAIGVAGAFGVALAAREYDGDDSEVMLAHLDRVAAALRATRPTAVNLSWGIDRALRVARGILAAGDDGRPGVLVEQAWDVKPGGIVQAASEPHRARHLRWPQPADLDVGNHADT